MEVVLDGFVLENVVTPGLQEYQNEFWLKSRPIPLQI